MKIALVQSHMTGSGFWGGVLICRQIASGLAAAGHDVHTVEFTHEPDVGATRLGNFMLHRLPAAPMHDGINPLWAWYPHEADVKTATDFLTELAPDVVYAHMISENTAIYEATIRMGTQIVHHVHDFAFFCARSFLVDEADRPCPGPTSPQRCESCLRGGYALTMQLGMRVASAPGGEALFRSLLGRRRSERFRLRQGVDRFFAFSRRYTHAVTRWIATGPRIRDVLCRHGVASGSVTLLPHSLPDDRLIMSQPPPPLAGRPLRIGYFGRISPEKGVELLADSLYRLRSRLARDFEWWIVSGSIPADVRESLRERSGLPSDRLRFVEGVRGADLNPVLAQLDVCVVPSLWPEIGPLTLLEALAQGVPCICNDMAGHAYLVEDGVNGFQFRTGDAADLQAKLATLLTDKALVERLRSSSPRIANFQAFVREIETVLDSTAQHRNRLNGHLAVGQEIA